jgi:hypothetical protein
MDALSLLVREKAVSGSSFREQTTRGIGWA